METTSQTTSEKVPQWIVETRREKATLSGLGFANASRQELELSLKDRTGQILWSNEELVLLVNAADDQAVQRAKFLASKIADAVKSVRFVFLPSLKYGDDLTDFAAARNGSTAGDLMALLDGAEYFELPKTNPAVSTQYDDATNARNFVAFYGGSILWHSDAGKWLVWSNTHWSTDNRGIVENLAKQFAAELYQAADSKQALAHAVRSNNRNGLTAIVELAKTEPGITVESSELDKNKLLFNCRNGTIDLTTGELLKHDRAHLITKLAPFDFDTGAPCPYFDAFLESVQPDSEIREYLQKAIGYSLTGLTSERAFFILHGIGRNGKSVFTDLFSQLFGDYSRNTTADSLMKKQAGGGIPNDIARLKGARFVTTPETGESDQLNTTLIKALAGGGDKITARFLFGEFFDFYFESKLWIATNHKPQIRDQSSGMWDRIVLIPFNVRIGHDEMIDKETILQNLLAEASGILAWAVLGCLAWIKAKPLVPPEAIKKEIEAYKFEQDSIAQFLAESTLPGEGKEFQIENGKLYDKYKHFCEQNGEFKLSHRRLTQSLAERGFRQVRSPQRYWLGLRLLE